MNKFFAILLGLALIVGIATTEAHAAAATVTETEYGYSITGGTDETLIYAGAMRIKSITYVALTANNVATFRSGDTSGTRWYLKAATVSNAAACSIYFGEYGAMFRSLSVTLTDAQDVVMIFNK